MLENSGQLIEMLCSNLVKRFKNIVIIALVLVSYASIVLCRSDQIAKNAIKPEKSGPNNATTTATNMKNVPFVEYYIEHNINEGEAKRSFFETGIKLLDDKPLRWCMECTRDIKIYCLQGKMLDDHCCCDSRHGTEQFPWIPHSCYVGERCSPSTGSCINYTEIRQCCCDRLLAKHWKEIFSSSMPTTTHNLFTQLVCVLLLLFLSRSLH